MSSTQYPILDNKPINKWKVAELRDELKRRSLPTKGLKDDLVKRLDEAIRDEREATEAEEADNFNGGSEHLGNYGDAEVESSGIEMAYQTPEHGKNKVKTIDEAATRLDIEGESESVGKSGDMKVETGGVDMAGEALGDGDNEIKTVNEYATPGNIDDDPSKVEQGKAFEKEETVGIDPITIVVEQEVNDGPTKIDQAKALEHEEIVTNPITMNYGLAKIDQVKALELEETVGTYSMAMVAETAVAEAPTPISYVKDEVILPNITASEGTPDNKKITQDNLVLESHQKGAVSMGEAGTLEANVEQIVEVMDSQVHETLGGMTDVPPEEAVESIEVKPEDMSLKSSQMDADHSESYSSDQVYEVSHNLGFQVKSESFSNDTFTVNEKDKLKENLTADNVQLEPEIVRPEMVQPSSNRDLPGDGIVHPLDDPVPQSNQTLHGETDDDKSKHLEFSKKNDKIDEMAVDNMENEATEKVENDYKPFIKDISPVSEHIEPSAEEMIDIAASGEEGNPQSMDENDFSKTDGPEGELLEKVNFDQSSADDSMDEDTLEAKHVDSDRNSSKVGDKTESNKEPVDGGRVDAMQDIKPSDKLEASNDHKDSVAASSEKRKFQDAMETGNKELPKKQRRWNTESQEVAGSRNPGAILSTKPKDSLLTASSKPNLTSSNSLLGGEAPKERVVPPSQKTPTTSLRIDHFLRPFTLKAVQELLGKTGKVSSFWMDHIKTHCYVMYSSVEEAIETRNAIYNLQWPPNGGRNLVADFVDPEEVKLRSEAPSPSAAPSVITSTSAVKAQPPPPPAAPSHPRPNHESPHPLSRLPPTRDPPTMREQLPRAPSPVAEKPEPPIVTLDDLFRKTRATPRIYYLPLTDEQVAVKVARQKRDRR